jgi:hypothetical protein
MWRGNGEWTARDDLLALALQIYEDSICPECGWSSFLTSDGDYDGHFRIGERDCMGCKAVEQWQDSQERKNKQQHPRKGLKHYLWMKLHNPNGT